MSFSDPIADMLTRIRNANKNKADLVVVPHSKIIEGIVGILNSEGYISGFAINQVEGSSVKKEISIQLKYHGEAKERTINGLKRISKPGLRVYAKCEELPKALGGLGIVIVSTHKGILTDKTCRAKKLGGEVLAFVW